MAEVNLNFVLVGRTGQGMSATGNTILNRRVFKTSSNSSSETKDVNFSFTQFNKYTILVVDQPGLHNTDLDKVQDKITAARNMDQAMSMCFGGVDAFLLVIKFGNRYTQEDREALETLNKIFGDSFLDHVIVVVTYGYLFHLYVGDTDPIVSFNEWCRQQYGELGRLYSDCDGRFVLFNNMGATDEINRAQITELAQMAQNMTASKGRYTSECFITAQFEREKWIQEAKAPMFRAEVEEKVGILASEMNGLFRNPSSDITVKIRSQVNELNNDIMRHDQESGVLQGLNELVKPIEEKLKCAEKIDSLSKELEEHRKAAGPFGPLGLLGFVLTGTIRRSFKELELLKEISDVKAKWKTLNE